MNAVIAKLGFDRSEQTRLHMLPKDLDQNGLHPKKEGTKTFERGIYIPIAVAEDNEVDRTAIIAGIASTSS